MSVSIQINNLSKMYKLYDLPNDRLKEALSLVRKKRHKEYYALRNISFDVKQGEMLGIIGTNGAGKSTLLKIITGVLNQTEGTMRIEGRISAILELGAGFNPEYTGVENIYLNGTVLGYTHEEMEVKIEDIISFADIGGFINQSVKTYSSGMFARLAFAVAINVDPDILIVDEALAVGDLDFQLKCMAKFNEFRDKKKTILFVSHDINSIKRYCDKVVWLKNGKVEAQGDTNYVTDKYLDFLKRDEGIKLEETDYVKATDIAQITEIYVVNSRGERITDIAFGDSVQVKLEFDVKKKIGEIVVGIAIKTIDHKYICGLNTLLDGYNFEYHIGRNIITLEYKNINLIGGSYYFDAAIFESNAHIPIDHRVKIMEFFVHTPYVGEGECILEHEWKKEV